jgi:hypothetical protein
MSRAHRWLWFAPPLLLLALLWPVLAGRYFADDWQFALADPGADVFGSFGKLHPDALYRPLELSAVALGQVLFPGTTAPVHLLGLLVHLTLIAAMVHALTSLRASRLVIGVTVLVLTVSQLNAAALGGNDTLSIVLGTLFGSLAVWWFRPSAHRGGGRRTAFGLAALTVALLSRESSLGYVPLLVVMALRPLDDGSGKAGGPGLARRAVRPLDGWREAARVVAVLALAAVYLGWRAHLGALGPDADAAAWKTALVAPVRLVLLWSAALVPVSTIDVVAGATLGRWLWPAAAAAGVGVVVLVVGIGLGPARWGRAGLYMAAASLVVAPVLALGRVGELYAYALLPAAALLLGYGYGAALLDRRRAVRSAAAISLAVFALGQATATRGKARGMVDNGERAVRQMARVVDAARTAPPGGRLVLEAPAAAVSDTPGARGMIPK